MAQHIEPSRVHQGASLNNTLHRTETPASQAQSDMECSIGRQVRVGHTARLACGNSENVIQMLQSRPGASA